MGVVRYNVHRSTTAGFTPNAANRVGQPTGTSFTDTPPAGTYYYKVTAEDGVGQRRPRLERGTARRSATSPRPRRPGR